MMSWPVGVRFLTELGVHCVSGGGHHGCLFKLPPFHRVALRDLLGVGIENHLISGPLVELLFKVPLRFLPRGVAF